jgi:hypothetical protein
MKRNRIPLLLAVVIALISFLPAGTLAQRGIVVTSLNDMVFRSEVILEVDVKSVFPSYGINPRPDGTATPATDALLRSTRVLKGSQPQTDFVVGQLGGTLPGRTGWESSQLMQAGKRYIVFLRTASPAAVQALPQRATPRYELVGAHLGLVAIDEAGNARLDSELPFYKDYDRKAKEMIISEIISLVARAIQPR